MKTHQAIDLRSLRLAEAIVQKLEAGDVQSGIERARMVNRKWRSISDSRLHRAWSDILQRDWPEIRAVLLDPDERGAELRQNNPFCGILSAPERWHILREFRRHEA